MMRPNDQGNRTTPGTQSLSGWLLASLVISIFIQVAALRPIEPVTQHDSREYLAISRSIVCGQGYSIRDISFAGFESFRGEAPTRMRQPLYPLYLAVFYWLLGRKVLIVQLSQILLNAFTLYIIFLTARRVFGQRLWPWTIMGLALYAPLWITSAFVLTESLFIFLIAGFMLLFLEGLQENRAGRLAFAGLVLGCAFLTRPIALAMCIVSLIVCCLRLGLRKGCLSWGLVVLLFAAAAGPWAVRNAIAMGEFTPLSTEGGYNIWYAAVPDNEPKWLESEQFKEAVRDGYYIDRMANRRFIQMAVKRVAADPLDYIKRGIHRMLLVWSFFPHPELYGTNGTAVILLTVLQIALLFFAILGLISLDLRRAVYLLLPATSFTLVLLVSKGISRFLVPAMPYMVILAGQGLHTTLLAIRSWWSMDREGLRPRHRSELSV